jgi:hypothetical protein
MEVGQTTQEARLERDSKYYGTPNKSPTLSAVIVHVRPPARLPATAHTKVLTILYPSHFNKVITGLFT